MATNFYERYISFLQKNYEHELIRNDLKSIIKTFNLGPAFSAACHEFGLDQYVITNNTFVYAFFLLELGVNVLPYLGRKEDVYDNQIFSVSLQTYEEEIFELITKLTTIVIPGDKKTIEAGFLSKYTPAFNITTIVVEEGVEVIELEAFGNLKKLKDIYLPGSLKQFGDIIGCDDQIKIHFTPVWKKNGKRGVGFEITSLREDAKEWFAKHLVKNN